MIEIHDLFCLYTLPSGEAVAALRGLSLSVADGEAVALVGPNGAGKSTLVRVVTGEVPGSAGAVTVGGRVPSTAVRRDLLGIIEQDPGRTLRPELGVVENVALQCRLRGVRRAEARRQAEEVLAELGWDAAPSGSGTLGALSEGEVRRVAIAAALAHEPRVILADEPTSGLPPEEAAAVLDRLRRAVAQRGASLLLVTHDPATAAIADRVVRIRDGRISEEWLPGHPEHSVVDDRGWLRLPEPQRPRMGRLVSSETVPEGVRLVPVVDRPHAPAEAPPVPVGRTPPAGPLVELTGVAVTRGSSTLPLPRELRLDRAGVAGVSGGSGAGKSTLLRLVAGLEDPDEGEIRVGGECWRPLGRQGRADLRRRWVALVQGRSGLAEELDPAANLALARQVRRDPSRPSADDEAIRAVLELLDLHPLAGRPARVLSGGERQRLLLARAIDSGCPLLLLDDPTSQQDEARADLVARVVSSAAAAGRTVVVTTHDPVVAAVADQAIVLENPAPST